MGKVCLCSPHLSAHGSYTRAGASRGTHPTWPCRLFAKIMPWDKYGPQLLSCIEIPSVPPPYRRVTVHFFITRRTRGRQCQIPYKSYAFGSLPTIVSLQATLLSVSQSRTYITWSFFDQHTAKMDQDIGFQQVPNGRQPYMPIKILCLPPDIVVPLIDCLRFTATRRHCLFNFYPCIWVNSPWNGELGVRQLVPYELGSEVLRSPQNRDPVLEPSGSHHIASPCNFAIEASTSHSTLPEGGVTGFPRPTVPAFSQRRFKWFDPTQNANINNIYQDPHRIQGLLLIHLHEGLSGIIIFLETWAIVEGQLLNTQGFRLVHDKSAKWVIPPTRAPA